MTGVVAAAVVLLLAVLAIEAATRILARRVFRVRRLPSKRTPAELGLPYEAVAFATVNGKMLHGWFIPPPAAPAPAVAVVHGWGVCADLMLPLAPLLHGGGYGVLLFDARCHGRSDDDDFASMPRFAEDLDAALDWLHQRPEVSGTAALGHSVGGAAAILVASRRDDLRGAVAISAFAHPATLMRRFLDERRVPHWPLGWWIIRRIEWFIGHRYDDIAPVRVVSRIRCPLLLVHGAADAVTPLADARLIHASRGAAAVHLRVLAGAGHNPMAALRRHGQELIAFLDASSGAKKLGTEPQ